MDWTEKPEQMDTLSVCCSKTVKDDKAKQRSQRSFLTIPSGSFICPLKTSAGAFEQLASSFADDCH
ncbi:hypothetical protein DHL47_07745 [Streptococcus panodentis]|uniref:Uncharacterized protein n=1 Tax=Streptococcus panodentis TaxID=1581472 RepID=A0ABS5AXA1_9STRE|nr:hypothetical protein [Streptococcus panodentis]